MKYSLEILHLYPREMSIYGDRGNVTALVRRLEWRGIKAHVSEVGVGDVYDIAKADIIFAGGGQDKGQVAVGKDLRKRAQSLRQAADDGAVMLLICGTYQLFGHYFQPHGGERIAGISIFDAQTTASGKRMIGNVVIKTSIGELVGFENHSGQTVLNSGQAPLGQVKKGFGNNGQSGEEGAIYKNVFGTYLHGSLLPKNPGFADHLLTLALRRKYPEFGTLAALDDRLEKLAAKVAKKRPQ